MSNRIPLWQSAQKDKLKPQLRWLNLSLAVAIIGLVITQAVMTNTQVARGAQVNDLQQIKTQLVNATSQLRWQVAQYKSLSYIQQQATTKLQMQSLPKDTLYLPSPTSDHETP